MSDHSPSFGRAEARVFLASSPKVEFAKNVRNPLVLAGGGAPKPAFAEAYKSLRARILGIQSSRGIRSIAVSSAMPSAGKTVMSLNLALCCAQLENLSILLVDADLRTRGLSGLIGCRQQTGLANVLSGGVSYDEAIAETDIPNLFVMSAGTGNMEPAELFSTERWKRLIEWAGASFKLVLVDSLTVGSVADYELIAQECDSVMLVVRAQTTPRAALTNALEQVDQNKLIGVVWNGDATQSQATGAYFQHSARLSTLPAN